MTTVDELRQAQIDEYSVFVAISPIDYDGVRAFNPGDPVPTSHVTAYKYDEQGLVAKRTTKAAQRAVSSEGGGAA